MKKVIPKHCPFCSKKSYLHQIKPLSLNYKSHTITIQQPGYWCNECDEGVIGGKDRQSTQKELQTFRAHIDGLVSPDEVKAIRKKLHLTQEQAAHLFGGGINAFSRYERGETPPSKPLSILLLLLKSHPNLYGEILPNPLSPRKHGDMPNLLF